MDTTKRKRRKLSHPDLLWEESTSDDSSSSNQNNDQSTLNKKPRFWHSYMLKKEEQSSSDESETNFMENDQIGGEISPTPGSSQQQLEPTLAAQPEPIAGPSHQQLEPKLAAQPEPIAGPSHILNPQLQQPQQLAQDNSSWFEAETKVFENEDFSVFIQKQDHKRQKVFRLEDHLFVMRIKLKNHKKPPLLSSIRNIIEETMTVMINDLKNHYNSEESNLIYVTIKQPG
jgi:hypothetical protein